jgi:GT2 family glycosyltransferase
MTATLAPRRLATARVRLSGGSGFARAANAGLAWAESEGYAWALVLNDDARPEPGCVDALLAAAGPGVGAVGPVLLGPEGVESAGIRFSERTARLKQVTEAPAARRPVDALSGACLLIPSDRRFDEAFGHGMEDVALCRAAPSEGLAVLVEPQARCWHQGGATVSRRSAEAVRPRGGRAPAAGGGRTGRGGGWCWRMPWGRRRGRTGASGGSGRCGRGGVASRR